MPIYKVKPEQDYPMTAPSGENRKKKRYPSVTIPVSPEIIAALEVGKPVVVELKGTVRGLESRQSATPTRTCQPQRAPRRAARRRGLSERGRRGRGRRRRGKRAGHEGRDRQGARLQKKKK
jgi:hypothetical protein